METPTLLGLLERATSITGKGTQQSRCLPHLKTEANAVSETLRFLSNYYKLIHLVALLIFIYLMARRTGKGWKQIQGQQV
jgi:hypothetical protein